MMNRQDNGLPHYKQIERNDFVHRKHKKQKEEDIAICICRYKHNDPDSACGERCLNVLTSTECTPGFCPCGSYCKNQRFQKCEYAKVKLFHTEGRGWGLLADENIKVGQFVIEYCGEVISWKEAKRRSQAYEAEGLKDAYIISLDTNESIDATRKGSLARFINHSCQSNCETRKWNVLGEVRVGIFAKQEISAGTELSYNYNFEWYGGDTVRCLCGAACCSGFLGAKSRGFQEANFLWEDDDDRFSVEKVPLYDSEEDDISDTSKANNSNKNLMIKEENDYSLSPNALDAEDCSHSTAISVKPLSYIPVGGDMVMSDIEIETASGKDLYSQDGQLSFTHKNAMISCIRSNSACRNYHIEPNPLTIRAPQYPASGKSKNVVRKQLDVKAIGESLAWKEAREELFAFEEMRNHATSQLDSLYNEIRSAIEEHERDSQDSVPTGVAEKWIEASCCKLKAEFDLYSSVIKNIACTPRRSREEVPSIMEGREEVPSTMEDDGIKLLEMG